MSFPDFLNASYALLTEEHQRIDPLKDLLQLSEELVPSEPRMRTVSAPSVDAQNKRSLQELDNMMRGVQRKR